MTKTEFLFTISIQLIEQTNYENKEKYQLRDYKLIQYPILQANIKRTVWQKVRRITDEILEVKGLIVLLWEPDSLLNIDTCRF